MNEVKDLTGMIGDYPTLPISIKFALEMYANRLTEWETWSHAEREALNASWRKSGHRYCHTDDHGHDVYIASDHWAENALVDLADWQQDVLEFRLNYVRGAVLIDGAVHLVQRGEEMEWVNGNVDGRKAKLLYAASSNVEGQSA